MKQAGSIKAVSSAIRLEQRTDGVYEAPRAVRFERIVLGGLPSFRRRPRFERPTEATAR
jgi:hypothetical protein